MAGFEEKAVTEQVTYTKKEEVEEVAFRPNPDAPDGSVPVQVVVTFMLDKDGEARRVSKRVPQVNIDNVWPQIKQYIFGAIDAAE